MCEPRIKVYFDVLGGLPKSLSGPLEPPWRVKNPLGILPNDSYLLFENSFDNKTDDN
jgi:hypothetical protein